MPSNGKKGPSSSNGGPRIPNTLPPCKVCGGEGTGFHYGVNSCEPCKAFFHRCLRRKEDFQCVCSAQSSDAKEKKMGLARSANCRYAKCLSVGMSQKACKTGRYSYTKRKSDQLELLRLVKEGKLTEDKLKMKSVLNDSLTRDKSSDFRLIPSGMNEVGKVEDTPSTCSNIPVNDTNVATSQGCTFAHENFSEGVGVITGQTVVTSCNNMMTPATSPCTRNEQSLLDTSRSISEAHGSFYLDLDDTVEFKLPESPVSEYGGKAVLKGTPLGEINRFDLPEVTVDIPSPERMVDVCRSSPPGPSSEKMLDVYKSSPPQTSIEGMLDLYTSSPPQPCPGRMPDLYISSPPQPSPGRMPDLYTSSPPQPSPGRMPDLYTSSPPQPSPGRMPDLYISSPPQPSPGRMSDLYISSPPQPSLGRMPDLYASFPLQPSPGRMSDIYKSSPPQPYPGRMSDLYKSSPPQPSPGRMSDLYKSSPPQPSPGRMPDLYASSSPRLSPGRMSDVYRPPPPRPSPEKMLDVYKSSSPGPTSSLGIPKTQKAPCSPEEPGNWIGQDGHDFHGEYSEEELKELKFLVSSHRKYVVETDYNECSEEYVKERLDYGFRLCQIRHNLLDDDVMDLDEYKDSFTTQYETRSEKATSIVEDREKEIYELVRFLKQLPEFKQMSLSTQMNLLKESFHGLSSIANCRTYDAKSGIALHGKFTLCPHEVAEWGLGGRLLSNEIHGIAETIKSLRLTFIMKVLLKMVVFFNPEYVRENEKQLVGKLNEKYRRHLLKMHIENRAAQSDEVSRKQIEDLIIRLSGISKLMRDRMEEVKFTSFLTNNCGKVYLEILSGFNPF